jgi:hypothetical protein
LTWTKELSNWKLFRRHRRDVTSGAHSMKLFCICFYNM